MNLGDRDEDEVVASLRAAARGASLQRAALRAEGGGRSYPRMRDVPSLGYRSSTSRRPFAPEQQIIIVLPAARSVPVRISSR